MLRALRNRLKEWRKRNREYAIQRALYKQGHPGGGISPGMDLGADEGHGSRLGPGLGYGRDPVETDDEADS